MERPIFAEPHPSLTTTHPETDCTSGWRKEVTVCNTRHSFQKLAYLNLGYAQYLLKVFFSPEKLLFAMTMEVELFWFLFRITE
jgi:hypothetical protein